MTSVPFGGLWIWLLITGPPNVNIHHKNGAKQLSLIFLFLIPFFLCNHTSTVNQTSRQKLQQGWEGGEQLPAEMYRGLWMWGFASAICCFSLAKMDFLWAYTCLSSDGTGANISSSTLAAAPRTKWLTCLWTGCIYLNRWNTVPLWACAVQTGQNNWKRLLVQIVYQKVQLGSASNELC